MSTRLQDIIARYRNVPGEVCATITFTAAGTFADAKTVKERIKHHLQDAADSLRRQYGERRAAPVIERLRDMAATIRPVDHEPGVVILANEHQGEVVHVPFRVEERVTVGNEFFLRDLLRAGVDTISFHVLLLSMEHAHLFAVRDTDLINEVRGVFPLRNRHYTTDVMQVTTSRGQDRQQLRFHQEVDEAVRGIVGAKGRVIVACTSEHYADLLHAADDPSIYRGNLKGNFEHLRPLEMMLKAWELVYAEHEQRNLKDLERVAEVTLGRMSTSMDDIWALVRDGRGHVLFVERDKHQPALFNDHEATLLEERADHAASDDLVDAIIEEQIEHGGEVRLLPNGSMERFGGIALELRY